MKSNALSTLSLIALFLIIGINTACPQIGVGVRNNRYVYGEYLFKQHYQAGVEISVFSEKIGFQYARGRIGYISDFNNFNLSGQAYYGSAFNRSFYDVGAMASLRYTAFNRVFANGTFNPNYDSGYGYRSCFDLGAGVIITSQIDLFAKYTTIPEYRMSEKRVHLGLDFKVHNLSVNPILSIGTSAPNGGKNLRMLINFNYTFGNK